MRNDDSVENMPLEHPDEKFDIVLVQSSGATDAARIPNIKIQSKTQKLPITTITE